MKCCSTILNFNFLTSNKNLSACYTNTDSNITQWNNLENNHNNSLSLKFSSNLKLLVNHSNNATPENIDDPEKIYSSKYYHIMQMITLKYLANKSLALSPYKRMFS